MSIEGPFTGKVALVTGASRGIGRATALKLAGAGCDIVANYFNSHREAETLCAAVRGLGRRALAVQGNVADPASVDEVFARVRGDFDRIDLLVSNAASGVLRPVSELTVKHWRWCLETNALALSLFAQRAVPLMAAGSSIVALSSVGATFALPGYAFIGASKAALESLVRSLAFELGARGIRVNAVSAGPVDTDALRAFPEREALLRGFRDRAPAGRTLTVDDVAGAVYLLCLPEAGMITGQTVVVDGGFSIVAGT